MSKILLWLDDYRDPNEIKDGIKHWLVFSPFIDDYKVVWVKSFHEFRSYIELHGIPDGICFDYDLNDEYNGAVCAKWLVEYCQYLNCNLPVYNIHSANSDGKDIIDSLLK